MEVEELGQAKRRIKKNKRLDISLLYIYHILRKELGEMLSGCFIRCECIVI